MAVAVATPRSVARAALAGMRPKQWSKNLLLFAGLLFANKLGDATRWLEACVAFAAYCAASSAAYLANDVRDAEHDRAHPVKRLRPVASGELPARVALWLSGRPGRRGDRGDRVPRAVGRSRSWRRSSSSRRRTPAALKHLVLIDVFAIAGLFVIRAAAGAQAVDVRISPWLLICTGLLALFLALAKRRAELVLVGAEATPGRPVLEGYSLALVDQLVTVVAASTVIAYSLYTFTAHDTKAMMATIPFVVYGVFRYLLLLHRHDLGEEPENVLLTDVPLIAHARASAVGGRRASR